MIDDELSSYFQTCLEAAYAIHGKLNAHRASCKKRPCSECLIWLCKFCGQETGNEPITHTDMKRPAMCDGCLPAYDRGRLLDNAIKSIPTRFQWATFENREDLRKRVPSYVKQRNPVRGLIRERKSAILQGVTGAGKTSLACYMLRTVIEAGRALDAPRNAILDARDAFFVASRDLALARMQNPLGKDEAPLIDKAIRASFLVIDDCGTEADLGRQSIIDVIAARHDKEMERPGCKKVTWVTTWMEQSAFGARFSGGTERRLIEEGAWIQLEKA